MRQRLSEREEHPVAAPDLPSPAGAVVIVPPALLPASGSLDGSTSALGLAARQAHSGGSIGGAQDEIAHAMVREIMSANGAEAERAARSAELPVSTVGDGTSAGAGVRPMHTPCLFDCPQQAWPRAAH